MRDAREVMVAADAVLQERLRAILRESSMQALADGRRWSMAIPGGSVVTRLLSALGPHDLAWSEGDIFWVDERIVPMEDHNSNAGASWRGWLGPLWATGVRVHPMPVDAPTPLEGARRYERELVDTLGATAAIDVLVVGVGEDGHVCSLFPGHPALSIADTLVAPVEDSPKPPPRRLTMTFPCLARSRCVVVAAFGGGKRAVIREALQSSESTLPVARLLRLTARAIVLLDPAAAGGEVDQLEGRTR